MIKHNLMSPAEAAAYLNLKTSTLAVWRCTGRYNLKYVKVGGRVQYRRDDLDAFIVGNVHMHTAN